MQKIGRKNAIFRDYFMSFQVCNRFSINLNHGKVEFWSVNQELCEHPSTGTNLKGRLGKFASEGIANPLGDIHINEKMLAEGLFRFYEIGHRAISLTSSKSVQSVLSCATVF
jgi:hypothetical protein